MPWARLRYGQVPARACRRAEAPIPLRPYPPSISLPQSRRLLRRGAPRRHAVDGIAADEEILVGRVCGLEARAREPGAQCEHLLAVDLHRRLAQRPAVIALQPALIGPGHAVEEMAAGGAAHDLPGRGARRLRLPIDLGGFIETLVLKHLEDLRHEIAIHMRVRGAGELDRH